MGCAEKNGQYTLSSNAFTLNYSRVFQDKIKFYILRQNLHHACFNDFSNV